MASFKDDDLGWSSVFEGIEGLAEFPETSVGFFDEENASKAVYAEYGTERAVPRPFMSNALDANADKYFDLYRGAMIEATSGKDQSSESLARGTSIKVGIEVRNDLIDSIIGGSWAPNKQSTEDSKGFNLPLVDTGAMQRAIDFKVGTKDGE